MMRLLGVDIPSDKKIAYALRYIHGLGPTRASRLCEIADINPNTRASELSEEEISRFLQTIQSKKWVLEGDLRREVSNSIKRLQSIRSYRGLRHQKGLPVRGQRTQTNARTRKGKIKTVGMGKKK